MFPDLKLSFTFLEKWIIPDLEILLKEFQWFYFLQNWKY